MITRYEAMIHQTPTDEYTPDIHFKFKTISELFTFLDSTLIHGQTDMEIIVRKMDFLDMEENDND